MDRVFRPFRLQPPLVVPKLNRLFLRAYRHDQPSGCRTHSAGFRSTSLGLRLSPAGSPRRQAESSSCSSGLVIHLPMLSTSRCREAVSFGYRTRFRPDGDSHPAGSIHLQTHWRMPPGMRMGVHVPKPGFARLEAYATGPGLRERYRQPRHTGDPLPGACGSRADRRARFASDARLD